MDRSKSIALLNIAIADELRTVNQYMYFHFHLDDQGFGPLAQLFKRTAIEEMGHIEKFADRILFLKGEVEMVPNGPVEKIIDPKAMLEKAMAMEQFSQDEYNQAAFACAANADAATKQLFEAVLLDEEKHFDQYDKQSDNIQRFGLNYLALESFTANSAPGTGPAAT